MTARDMALAALTSVLWGLAFVATKLALESFTAPQLTALRFLLACLPVLLLPRPQVSWPMLILIGMTLFTGQFLLLFFAFEHGMPPGLASVTQQLHAFFTVILAAIFLADRPTSRQTTGMAVAFAGLGLIGATIGGDVSVAGLALALGAAASWAIGNVLVKRIGRIPMLSLMVWLSLVPPLPALLVSHLSGDPTLVASIAAASWTSLGAAVYLGTVATLAGYSLWNGLLSRNPSAAVAPFALLAPCVGVISSALVFGERFTPLRASGMALILAGLAIVVVPRSWIALGRR
jgi:O-acetylserine/cysteine efflux transporter